MNELGLDSKQKLFKHMQILKLVLSVFALIIFHFIIDSEESRLSYIPFLAAAMLTNSIFSLIAFKYDKNLEWISYLSPLIDITTLFYSIYLSNFPYNSLIFYTIALSAVAYFLTNIRYAIFLGFLVVSFRACLVYFYSVEQQDQLITSLTLSSYNNTFTVSVAIFMIFLTYVYYFTITEQRKYALHLNRALKDIESLNTYPLYNPNPIFQYKLGDGLFPKNELAQKMHSSLSRENILLLKESSLRCIESHKEVTCEIEHETTYYKVQFIWTTQQVNIYVIDITDIVESKKKALLNEQYTKAIIDAMPGFVSWVNKDLEYLGINSQMANFFGMPTNYFLGKKLGQVNNESETGVADFVRAVFESNQDELQTKMHYVYNGQEFHNLLNVKKYNNNKNAVLVSIDITELETAQMRIAEEQSKAEQNAKLASFGEMAAGIAHEINNPLAVISGTASKVIRLLEREKLTEEEIAKSNERIVNNVKKISTIIRGMKNLARDGENDPFEFAYIKDIIEDSLTLFKKKCRMHSIELLVSEFDDKLGINCQRVQVSQALVILLNNSMDALEESESQEKWIKVLVAHSDSNITISVMDSGHGIAEQVRQKIFEPFFTTKGVGKGTGLGLSLAVRIIESHRGQFSLDDHSENTKFDIELPLAA